MERWIRSIGRLLRRGSLRGLGVLDGIRLMRLRLRLLLRSGSRSRLRLSPPSQRVIRGCRLPLAIGNIRLPRLHRTCRAISAAASVGRVGRIYSVYEL